MEAGPLKQNSDWPTPPPRSAATSSAYPPVWTQRLLLVVEVAIAVWAGMLVIVLPWTHLWSDNPLLSLWPTLQLLVNQNFVRGMISGIGLVDIGIGISDAVHYRDQR